MLSHPVAKNATRAGQPGVNLGPFTPGDMEFHVGSGIDFLCVSLGATLCPLWLKLFPLPFAGSLSAELRF
jgi:hypothetical protein